jgi:hypothetical protein
VQKGLVSLRLGQPAQAPRESGAQDPLGHGHDVDAGSHHFEVNPDGGTI